MSAAECIVVHMPKVPGRRWRKRRARLDIDQAVAAEGLGISKRTVQNIETNPHHRGVSLEVIFRAERLYGVTADWLLGQGDDDKPEEAPKQEPIRRDPPGDPSGPPARPDRDRKGPPRTDLKQAS